MRHHPLAEQPGIDLAHICNQLFSPPSYTAQVINKILNRSPRNVSSVPLLANITKNKMKKVIKKKLFFQNGVSKNLFLWEIFDGHQIVYEIIEEFKGHRISRALLKGIYNQKIKAIIAFSKFVERETMTSRISPLSHVAYN